MCLFISLSSLLYAVTETTNLCPALGDLKPKSMHLLVCKLDFKFLGIITSISLNASGKIHCHRFIRRCSGRLGIKG